MVESEAGAFQAAGIQVGAEIGEAEERLLSEALAPFGVARRNRSLEMARLYAVLHCFENELRSLIRETLEEGEGPDWLQKLPQKVRDGAEGRQQAALKDSWLEGEKSDLWASLTSDISRRSSSRSGPVSRTSFPLSTG